jgi:TusA-related sulfurtransferase
VTVVEARGKRCPLPVIELARAFGSLPIGEEIEVRADDPAAAADIAAWSRMRGQEFVGAEELPDGGTAYRVRRRS